MTLSQAAILQAVVAVGIAVGAVVAATKVTLRQAASILPVGVAMGLIVMVLAMYDRSLGPQGAFELALSGRTIVVPYYVLIACAILMLIGGLAGFFVVPMNALLQHRGHVLMGAGHSIAVQNFNENLSILAMLAGSGDDPRGPSDQGGDPDLRGVRQRLDAARAAAAPPEHGARRSAAFDRGGEALGCGDRHRRWAIGGAASGWQRQPVDACATGSAHRKIDSHCRAMPISDRLSRSPPRYSTTGRSGSR